MTTTTDIHSILYTLERSGYSVADRLDDLHVRPVRLYYRNNPDGSIRWCWPAGARRADCLRFYNTGTWRARMAAAVIHLLFRMGMERCFSSGHLNLFTK